MTGFLRILGWILLLAAIVAGLGAAGLMAEATGSADEPASILVGILVFTNVALFGAAGVVLADSGKHLANLAGTQGDEDEDLADSNDELDVLGLLVQPEPTGLLVQLVEPNTTAEALGMRAGDYITRVNGATLAYLPTDRARLRALMRSSRAALTIQRFESTVDVTLR